MRCLLLAFAVGVIALQQQPVLPPASTVWALAATTIAIVAAAHAPDEVSCYRAC